MLLFFVSTTKPKLCALCYHFRCTLRLVCCAVHSLKTTIKFFLYKLSAIHRSGVNVESEQIWSSIKDKSVSTMDNDIDQNIPT